MKNVCHHGRDLAVYCSQCATERQYTHKLLSDATRIDTLVNNGIWWFVGMASGLLAFVLTFKYLNFC